MYVFMVHFSTLFGLRQMSTNQEFHQNSRRYEIMIDPCLQATILSNPSIFWYIPRPLQSSVHVGAQNDHNDGLRVPTCRPNHYKSKPVLALTTITTTAYVCERSVKFTTRNRLCVCTCHKSQHCRQCRMYLPLAGQGYPGG